MERLYDYVVRTKLASRWSSGSRPSSSFTTIPILALVRAATTRTTNFSAIACRFDRGVLERNGFRSPSPKTREHTCTEQRVGVGVRHFADSFDRQVRRWIASDVGSIERVVPLAWKHGGESILQRRFHGGQDAQLVIDHDVVMGRVPPLHVV